MGKPLQPSAAGVAEVPRGSGLALPQRFDALDGRRLVGQPRDRQGGSATGGRGKSVLEMPGIHGFYIFYRFLVGIFTGTDDFYVFERIFGV